MWKEVISFEDMEEVALLRNKSGCAVNRTALAIKSAIEKKPDCHYYHYKSDKIELVLGYKQMPDHIYVLAYTIKADVKDYPEAFRIMSIKAKEYIKNRECKRFIIGFGRKDISSVEFYNKGVSKVGFVECFKMAKIEHEKIGFTLEFKDNQIVVEL